MLADLRTGDRYAPYVYLSPLFLVSVCLAIIMRQSSEIRASLALSATSVSLCGPCRKHP
ncbi:hypothetical protein ASPFODRAFT_537242 [Aspergillus luchuensis CBS 106.47]|uniref:Uncharacterized protein n=1 Tax=Aspergillus luchuensis (strain CBS 106.47) TaxID=1137211 RepID=A0A1M3TNE2_ASPLC|nr:hypothetical protein ASPFODRAFT_537242 [Aspergillus luchuensis CBS 106.47]